MGSVTTKQMTDEMLRTFVRRALENSANKDGDDLSSIRQDNLDRYWGEDYGDEVEGQSQVKTREVMEVIEWAKPSLLRIFTGSDKFVSFDPVGKEDVQAAEDETNAVNHVFRKGMNGFTVLYDMIHDALLSPTAYVKIWWEEDVEESIETYHGIDQIQAQMLAMEPGAEITGVEIEQGPMGPVFSIEVKFEEKKGRIRGKCVPGEEVLVNRDLDTWDLDEAEFVCHYRDVTASDLLKMGYPKSIVDNLNYEEEEISSEEENRRFLSDEEELDDSDDPSLRKVTYYEISCLVDYDGDGIAERRSIVYCGDEILENDPETYQGMVALSALPQPHRHVGLDLANMVKDLQRISTVLNRQFLNNLYKVNSPRPIVGEGVNLQDILNASAPDSPIRAENINDIRMEPTAPIIGHILPSFEYLSGLVQKRSGINETSTGLDIDALTQGTKGAALSALEAANQRLELIARVMAETGISRIFLKIHELLRKHQDKPMEIAINGRWQSIDPRTWKKRSDMSIHVGIGNSTREQRLMSANMILNLQERLAKAGLKDRIVTEKNIFQASKLLVEAAGERNAMEYVSDPSQMPPPQPKPDPQMMLMQLQKAVEDGKRQVEQMRAHMDHMRGMGELQLKAKSDDEDRQLEREKAIADGRLKREQISAENARAEAKNDTSIRQSLISKGEVVELPDLDSMQMQYLAALNDAIAGMQQMVSAEQAARAAQQTAVRDWIAQNGSTRLKRLADQLGGNS